MSTGIRLVLLGVLILGCSMWFGGMATVTIVSRTSRSALAPADRVTLFRAFGPRFYATSGIAVIIGAACGLALLIARGWDGLATAIVILFAVLMATLGVGVRQARTMRRLRTAAHRDPDDESAGHAVISAGRSAALVRGLLGVVSLALFVLALGTAA